MRFGIGQSVPRNEDPRFVAGRGRYVADIDLPHQTHAVFLYSPHAHAAIRSIDVAAAQSMPGVFAVLTGRDWAADGLGAAERYGLKLLAQSIEDDPKNRTRFLVLGTQEAGPTGKDRTSMVMTTHNRPGSLLELIASFSNSGVNMTRLESRPARTGQWEYYFYVDIEGHQQDAKVAKALAELRGKAPFVKIFGSYPAAVL